MKATTTAVLRTRFLVTTVPSFWLLLILVLSLLVAPSSVWAKDAAFQAAIKETSDAALFEPCEEIKVSAPTYFPKPTRKIDDHAVPIVEPTFGVHRPNRDAVMAYAEGYHIPYYMMFMETLRETGFTGDVVLAIASPKIIKPDVVDYLRTFALPDDADPDDDQMHAVVYQLPLECKNDDGSTERALIPRSGDTDIFQMCTLSNVYGWKNADGEVTGTARDPREGRVVATLRYEWYWIWSLRYQPQSWLMLLDARDSFFQSDPFAGVPRQASGAVVKDGLLYLFGENAEATRLGKSKKNLKWLRNGYGDAVLQALADKPTICSGSTMGEQIAIETYLRAMVNEHDECDVKMTGSDQGFHNYLYYSSKLRNADNIRRIVVWEQGRGAINNLGALRIKPFSEWGLYDEETHRVYQWDGETLSPVAHQWDRDKHLHTYMQRERFKEWELEWQERKRTLATE